MAKNTMGEFLSALRRAKGYTQQEVADLLNVSNKTISSWECNSSSPDISMLPALAELYGVTCDELIRGERIVAPEVEPVSRNKSEKALALRLKRALGNANTFAYFCLAGAVLAVVLTLILGCAASRSRIGFFAGMIVLIASTVTILVVADRTRRFADQEEIGNERILDFQMKLFAITARALFANAVAFGFILPHLFVANFYGLVLRYALLYGVIGGAVVGILSIPVYYYCKNKRFGYTESEKKYRCFQVKTLAIIFGTLLLLSVGGGIGGAYTYSQAVLERLPELVIREFTTEEEAEAYVQTLDGVNYERECIFDENGEPCLYIVRYQISYQTNRILYGICTGVIFFVLAALWVGGIVLYRRKLKNYRKKQVIQK